MKHPIENYHTLRLSALAERLTKNNFDVHLAENSQAAVNIVINEIVPALAPRTIAWGGSMTFMDSGIASAITALGPKIINAKEEGISKEEKIERLRAAMTADLYFTGTNAVTQAGQLVNLDMVGNRVGALTFGPREVVVLIGQNKLVPDLETAMRRIKDYAAPANAMRLDMKTPCAKTGVCMDCTSPQRICNTWTITEKAFPPKRIKVILICEDLGL